MSVIYTSQDINRALGTGTVAKAEEVWADGQVLRSEASPDGRRLTGAVQGTQRQPYGQSIQLVSGDKRVGIQGYCTCPVGYNCKHVGAVLLQALHAGVAKAAKEITLDDDDFADLDFGFASGRRAVDRGARQARPAPTATPTKSAQPAGRPGPTAAPVAPATPTTTSGGIPREVQAWLDSLVAAGSSTPASTPAAPRSAGRQGVTQRILLFVLDHDLTAETAAHARLTRLRAVSAKIGKDGGLDDIRHIDAEGMVKNYNQIPAYVTEDDVTILRDIAWLKRKAHSGLVDAVLGTDAASVRLLDMALATGRLHLGSVTGPPMTVGPAVRAEPRWIKDDRGGQRLALIPVPAVSTPSATDAVATADAALDPAAADVPRFDRILSLTPPRYVDLATGQIGVIGTDMSPQLAAVIATAPAVGPSAAAMVRDAITRRLTRKPGADRTSPGDARADAATRSSGEDMAAATTATLVPLPETAANIETRVVVPVPCIELAMLTTRLAGSHVWWTTTERHRGQFELPVVRLAFDYDGQIVPVASPTEMLERMDGDKLVLMPRDHKAELAANDFATAIGLKPLGRFPFVVPVGEQHTLFYGPRGLPSGHNGTMQFIEQFDDQSRFLGFIAEDVPRLVKKGWKVTFADGYPHRVAEGEVKWWADTGESSGIDWFGFELGIDFDGQRINLVPVLANLLTRLPDAIIARANDKDGGKAFDLAMKRVVLYHRLEDGRMLPLAGERIAPIMRSLLALIGPREDAIEDGKIKLHRAEAGLLAKFQEAVGLEVAWAASTERLIRLGKDLRRGRGPVAVDPPVGFGASLRPYQSDGLAWLEFLRDTGFGGVLADDMGLGKTVQALAFLAREKAQGRLDRPALILAPTSVLPNWQAEAERFAPELKVLALRGLDRQMRFSEIASHDIVLTTYPLLLRDHETLLAHEFHVAILDEAQAIKNPKANVSTLAHRIDARHRFALTGTPLENNLGEVWSLFQFLSPGLLGDETTFRRTFRTPIEKHGDPAAQAFLTARLKPFMLRRTKAEVAKELPPKTEIVERIRLEGAQRDLYETVRVLMHAKVREEIAKKGIAKSHIVFLDALLKLRQVCCDPRLLKMEQARKAKGSAKLERLMEMIPEMVAEGRRILLFSQFTSMLALIEDELRKRDIAYVMLTGDTTDRTAPVKAFQSGKVPLFLLSLKAGGTGLNLTAADTVIHYDPWWNPAVENQATDRAHRIGQDKPVFVYKLIVEEGIEEAIELLKARKAALADALFAGSARSGLDLTESDISALFAPLETRRRKAA